MSSFGVVWDDHSPLHVVVVAVVVVVVVVEEDRLQLEASLVVGDSAMMIEKGRIILCYSCCWHLLMKIALSEALTHLAASEIPSTCILPRENFDPSSFSHTYTNTNSISKFRNV
jgi:hypothetical protein